MARILTTDPSGTAVGAAWIGDFLGEDTIVRGGAMLDVAQFGKTDAVTATVGVAGAAQGATSVPVAALSGPIPSGTLLDFTGSAKFARLTAAAAAGATTLTVEALPTALVSTDTATYAGVERLTTVPSGTLVGRTYTERDAKTGFGPAVNTDDEIYLLVFDVPDVATNPECALYRHGSLVKETFLPGWTTLATALKTAVRANYQTTIAAP
jgi:hypothetical protein